MSDQNRSRGGRGGRGRYFSRPRTCQFCSDPELKLCEGLRLIDATRTAVSRIAPASLKDFDREVLPRMRTALMERFGLSELPAGPVN